MNTEALAQKIFDDGEFADKASIAAALGLIANMVEHGCTIPDEIAVFLRRRKVAYDRKAAELADLP